MDQSIINLCDGWTYYHDHENMTHIYNDDGDIVVSLHRKASYDEVRAFKAGYGVGWDQGFKSGKSQKSIEIKQVLGIPL